MFYLNNFVPKILKRKRSPSQHELDKKLVFKLAKKRVPQIRQFKYFFHFLNKKEKLVVKIFLSLIIISLIFTGIRFYYIHLKIYPKVGGEYVEGLVGQPRFINPVLSSLNEVDQDISQLVFSGLLKYDSSENLVPELAESYTISQDQKTYIFSLKQDIFWHDGERFTSEDVVFTVNLIKNPDIKSPLFPSFRDVEIKATDEYTVKFILAEPYAPFPSVLTFGILPQHIWSEIPENQFILTEYNLKPIGNGPFKFKSLNKDKLGFVKSYSIERNPEYFKKPFLKNIHFKFYLSQEDALTALRNKNIDGLVHAQHLGVEKIEKMKDINKYSLYLPQYTALFFNPQNNSVLENLNVRQALAFSINKKKILKEVLAEQGEIIYGPISKGLIGYTSDVNKYDFNTEKANTLLEEAGWNELEQGFRKKDDQDLKVIITTIDRSDYIKTAELIKKFWENVGVKVELNIITPEVFRDKIIKSKAYEILLYSVISGFDPDPYAFWHSSQIDNSGLNLALYKNRKVDKLLGEARIMSDKEGREKRYEEFQQILAEDLPAIFLYNPAYNYFVDKRIRGIEVKRLSVTQDRFADIEKWYARIKRGF